MRMGTELRNSFTVNLLMSFLPNNTEKKENPLWQILRGKRGMPFFNMHGWYRHCTSTISPRLAPIATFMNALDLLNRYSFIGYGMPYLSKLEITTQKDGRFAISIPQFTGQRPKGET
mmetsp:Transcript_32344/g.77309  ORF Transcript_32344/g.77309 Transcript_32344/m.77309 type:complete len:117 (+) Transcript_32344:184-534(+)